MISLSGKRSLLNKKIHMTSCSMIVTATQVKFSIMLLTIIELLILIQSENFLELIRSIGKLKNIYFIWRY